MEKSLQLYSSHNIDNGSNFIDNSSKFMKKILMFVCFLCTTFLYGANTSLKETFETGMPTSASGSETEVTLASGKWLIKGVYAKKDNGSLRATMSGSGYLITPALDKPLNVSFSHRGSGNGKVLLVEKSLDGGLSWIEIGRATTSSSSSYGSSSIGIQEMGTYGVLLRFTCLNATIYIDDICIDFSDLCDKPTQRAAVSVTDVTGNSAVVSLVPGNGNGRLLVYKKGESVDFLPEDGTAYRNLPREVDGNIIAHYGNETQIEIEGLEAGATYHFAVYESNEGEGGINYLTKEPGRCEVKTLEVPTITVNVRQVAFGAVKTGTTGKRIVKLSAKYLNDVAAPIQVRTKAPFALSTDNVEYSETVSIPCDEEGTLAELPLYLTFNPTELTDYRGTLVASHGETVTTINLTGIGSNTNAKCYYIAPEGDDNNEGTFDSPWYNLQRAVDVVRPGDTIFCRGGIYYPTMKKDGSKTTVRLTANGTTDSLITIKNFPDEFPVLNFKDQPKAQSVRGIQLNGNYWHIRGLHITEAGDNGIKVEGSHNIIERCTFSYNDDTGLQLGFGHDFSDSGFGSSNDGTYCAYNDVIDCDSYLNCDSDNFGSDADGFACKMHNGKGNRFIRCRAWDNSDDAWDLYETDYPVYLYECWAWGSGRAEKFDWVQASGSFQGNGNAIKLGGNGTGGSSKGKHEAWNCIAFNCNKSGSVKGFDQNSHGDGVKLVNCLAFGCGYDFMFEKSSNDCEFYNNVCLGKIEIKEGAIESNNAMLSTSDKAWKNVVRGFSASDYESLSEEDAKAPRGEDGSLPTRFARLKEGSVLIDKGLDLRTTLWNEFPQLWQPVCGNGRDLGPYESSYEGTTGSQMLLMREKHFDLKDNRTHFVFSVPESGKVIVELISLQGVVVKQLVSMNAEPCAEYAIPYTLPESAKGVYLIRLTCKGMQKTIKRTI